MLYGGALFIGVPSAFSYVMTRAHSLASLASPSGGYRELWLNSEGLRLRAWLSVAAGERSAVVIVHGLGDSLESYLEHARPLRERGHSVLLVDLRGHGGSEGSYTTLGGRERADIAAAMDELRRRGLATHGIVLMGHSMGSVAVLLAAAKAKDVRAVIVEAPYDTYRNTIAHHASLLYHLPAWVPTIPSAIAARSGGLALMLTMSTQSPQPDGSRLLYSRSWTAWIPECQRQSSVGSTMPTRDRSVSG